MNKNQKGFWLEEKVKEFFYDYDPDEGIQPTVTELINWLYDLQEQAEQDAYERHYGYDLRGLED